MLSEKEKQKRYSRKETRKPSIKLEKVMYLSNNGNAKDHAIF